MFENIKWFFKRIYWIFHAENSPLYFRFNATKNYSSDYDEYKLYIHNKLNPTELRNNNDIKLYHFCNRDDVVAKLVIRLLKENDLYFPTIKYFLNRRIYYKNRFYYLVKYPTYLYSEVYQEYIKQFFPTKLNNLHKVYVILKDLDLI